MIGVTNSCFSLETEIGFNHVVPHCGDEADMMKMVNKQTLKRADHICMQRS